MTTPHYFLITGSRDFPESEAHVIHETLDNFIKWQPNVVMINGMARGVDSICYRWAKARGIEVAEYPADWNRYGKGAGHVRNRAMLNRLLAEKSTSVFAFFYGDPVDSRGTANMVSQCEAAGVSPIKKVVKRVPVQG